MRRWTTIIATGIVCTFAAPTFATNSGQGAGQTAKRAQRAYVVAPGDTLSEIALRFKVSLDQLMKHNELVNDHIVVGQRLRLPAPAFERADGAKKPGAIIAHRVEQGDTLGSIALRYNTTVRAIQIWNLMQDDKIKIGQRIQVPAVGPIPKRELMPYVIEAGDSIRSICLTKNLDQRVIKRLNKGVDWTTLKIGQKITIYEDVYVDPPAQAKPAHSEAVAKTVEAATKAQEQAHAEVAQPAPEASSELPKKETRRVPLPASIKAKSPRHPGPAEPQRLHKN